MRRPRSCGPATLLATALVGVSGAGFGLLADAAVEHDGAARIDPGVARDVVLHRSGPLTAAARLLTAAGSELVIGILAVLVVVALLRRRRIAAAITVAVGMAGSAALTVGLKLAIGRDRPGTALRLGPADESFSFPSGHTLNSAVLLGLTVLFLVPLLRRRALRAAAAVTAVLLALGVGLSRVYLGYHWMTDVVASWLVATAWLTLVLHGSRLPTPRSQAAPSQRLVSARTMGRDEGIGSNRGT